MSDKNPVETPAPVDLVNPIPAAELEKEAAAEVNAKPEDLDYMSDAAAAVLITAPTGARYIIWTSLLFLVVFLTWANWAELDEVTKGEGQVIPSGQIQIVQNLEGGILAEMKIVTGQVVEKNQVLLRIDDTRFISSLREAKSRYYSLLARRARLQAEATGTPLLLPKDVLSKAPEIADKERNLYIARRNRLVNEKRILKERISQREQELNEANGRENHLRRSLGLLQKELTMTAPLAAEGAISEVDVLRLRRQVNDSRGELESVRLSIPRLKSSMQEAGNNAEEVELKFRSEAREILTDVSSELSQLDESNVALQDRVKRTAVRSPVRGAVKQILVNTVGGVIQPGMDLIEIVPLDDTLLIEAKVAPRDIGFLTPGQKAIIKISAYDFAIFGGLEGKVEQISADAIEEEDGKSFYLVKVRTNKNYLESNQLKLNIISGMQAEVDVLTGKKTVLQYLLKPVLRAKGRALTER